MGSPCPQYSTLYTVGRECDVPSNEMPDELAADALARGFAYVVGDAVPENTGTAEPEEHKTRTSRRKK